MFLRILLMMFLLSPLLQAQQSDNEEGFEKEKREGPPPPPREGERPGGGRFFSQAMKRLKKENPERFEELQALKKEDPEKFREELHKTAREMMAKRGGDRKGMKKRGPDGESGHWLREMRQNDPERFEELMALRKESPEDFRAQMAKEFGDRMKEKPMVSHEKKKALKKALKQYHAASDGEKAEMKSALRKLLEDSFEEDLANRRKMAERLQNHLKEIEAQIEVRENSGSKLIDEKLEQLINHKPQSGPLPR